MTLSQLSRREALAFAGSAAFAASARSAVRPAYSGSSYDNAIVIDAQGGIGDTRTIRQDFVDVRSSGLTALSTTVGQVGNAPDRLESIIEDVSQIDDWFQKYGDTIVPVRRARDLIDAKRSRRTGLILNVQDTAALEGDVTRISLLKSLGIRIVQLTYNKRNLCGDGCLEPGNAGLSDFGHKVVSELNQQRLLIDLSHGGARTISDAARASKVPVAVTHTGCRALVDNQRNLADWQMREIADRGGVVGIYFIAYLRSGIGQPALNARREDLIRHVEYAANICGEDHIGLGTDNAVPALVIDAEALAAQKQRYEQRVGDGVATAGEGPDVFNYVMGYNTPRRFYTLANDLAARGWPARRIDKLIGGNFARLFSDVWEP
jgi:membrane dipeptidase